MFRNRESSANYPGCILWSAQSEDRPSSSRTPTALYVWLISRVKYDNLMPPINGHQTISHTNINVQMFGPWRTFRQKKLGQNYGFLAGGFSRPEGFQTSFTTNTPSVSSRRTSGGQTTQVRRRQRVVNFVRRGRSSSRWMEVFEVSTS